MNDILIHNYIFFFNYKYIQIYIKKYTKSNIKYKKKFLFKKFHI